MHVSLYHLYLATCPHFLQGTFNKSTWRDLILVTMEITLSFLSLPYSVAQFLKMS